MTYKLDDLIGKITCADCMDVLKSLPDKSVDLILTDVPYKMDFIHGMGIRKYRPNYNKISAYGANAEMSQKRLEQAKRQQFLF